MELSYDNINIVHCFFEQSGTFKNEFCKLGIYAEDYDIKIMLIVLFVIIFCKGVYLL